MNKMFTRFMLLLLLSGSVFAQVTVTNVVDKANPINLEEVTYTITVTNPDLVLPAIGVVVNCPIPRGLKFISADPSQGTYDVNTQLWTIGVISPGSSVDMDLKCLVNYFNSAYDVRDYYNYSLLLSNNADFTGSSIGGKIGAGNDMSLVGASIGGLLPVVSPVHNTVNSGNNLTINSSSIFNGNVVYGTTTNLPNATVVYPHGTLVNGSPFNFTAYASDIASLSGGLSGHIVNGITNFSSNVLTLTGTDIYLNIFSVPAASFSGSDSIIVNIPKGSIGVINVFGTSAQFVGKVNIHDNLNNFIMFNFPTATSLSVIGSHFRGSILAPFATVQCIGTLVQGQIFANNVTSISSHDLTNFVGYIPLNRMILLTATASGGNFATAVINVNTTPPFGSGGNGNWSVSSLLPDSAWVLSLVRKDSSTVLAGTFGGKIYHVDNNGVADTVINASMLPASAIWSMAVNDSGHIFAATTNGLARSNDGGLTWTETLANYDVRSILIGQDSNLYAGTWGFGVFKSTDGGYSWAAKNNNIGSTVVNALMDKIDTNALSTPYTLFAAAFQKGLSASWDNANNWLPLAMPYEFVTALGKTSDGILFLGTQLDGVYRSYDNGNSFHKLSGLPNGPIYSIKVDGDNNIFVSSWLNGIYASSDLGQTWTSLGLGGYGVSALYALPNGRLMAATSDGRIVVNESPLSTSPVSVATAPEDFLLSQNYPNPFNPSTKIQVSIPVDGNYKITIYNILGQQITTLHSGLLRAGNHQFTFNAHNLPAGVYVYRLSGNSVELSKKMLLLK